MKCLAHESLPCLLNPRSLLIRGGVQAAMCISDRFQFASQRRDIRAPGHSYDLLKRVEWCRPLVIVDPTRADKLFFPRPVDQPCIVGSQGR